MDGVGGGGGAGVGGRAGVGGGVGGGGVGCGVGEQEACFCLPPQQAVAFPPQLGPSHTAWLVRHT